MPSGGAEDERKMPYFRDYKTVKCTGCAYKNQGFLLNYAFLPNLEGWLYLAWVQNRVPRLICSIVRSVTMCITVYDTCKRYTDTCEDHQRSHACSYPVSSCIRTSNAPTEDLNGRVRSQPSAAQPFPGSLDDECSRWVM